MTETIEDLFVYLVFISDIVILFLIVLFNKQLKGKPIFKAIAAYCIIDFLTNFVVEFFPFDGYAILYSYFTLAEYLLFSLCLYLITLSTTFKKIIIACSLAFSIFLIIYTHSATIRSIDSTPIGIETILILIYSFNYLYEEMSQVDTAFIYNKFTFWIVSGIMVYLAGSFFIYVFANQVDRKTLDQFWFLTNIFYILKNILFALGILTYVKQTKNPRPEKLYPYLN